MIWDYREHGRLVGSVPMSKSFIRYYVYSRGKVLVNCVSRLTLSDWAAAKFGNGETYWDDLENVITEKGYVLEKIHDNELYYKSLKKYEEKDKDFVIKYLDCLFETKYKGYVSRCIFDYVYHNTWHSSTSGSRTYIESRLDAKMKHAHDIMILSK